MIKKLWRTCRWDLLPSEPWVRPVLWIATTAVLGAYCIFGTRDFLEFIASL